MVNVSVVHCHIDNAGFPKVKNDNNADLNNNTKIEVKMEKEQDSEIAFKTNHELGFCLQFVRH